MDRGGELWLPGDGDTGRPDPWTGDGDVQYSQVVVGPGGAAELDWTGDVEVPGAGEPGHYANPEILVAGTVDDLSVLGIGIDGRSKVCCAPVGWFSHDFVLFGAVRPCLSSAGLAGGHARPVSRQPVHRRAEAVCAASWAEDTFTSFGQ